MRPAVGARRYRCRQCRRRLPPAHQRTRDIESNRAVLRIMTNTVQGDPRVLPAHPQPPELQERLDRSIRRYVLRNPPGTIIKHNTTSSRSRSRQLYPCRQQSRPAGFRRPLSRTLPPITVAAIYKRATGPVSGRFLPRSVSGRSVSRTVLPRRAHRLDVSPSSTTSTPCSSSLRRVRTV